MTTSFHGERYRYGFNGMERDNELSGSGNSYTTLFRQYDPRLGRWKNLDPKFKNFPWQSPYAAFDNNPILKSDPKGDAAEQQEGGPRTLGDKIAKERSKIQDGPDTKKLKRLIAKLRNESQGNKGQFKDNRGGIGDKAKFARHGSLTETNNSNNGESKNEEIETIDNVFNRIGFKVVVTNSKTGEDEPLTIGKPSTTDARTPVWTKNSFNQKEGSPVIVDEKGNVMDNNNEGKVLIRLPKYMTPYDGIFEKGDTYRGERVTQSEVIRQTVDMNKGTRSHEVVQTFSN